MNGNLDIVESGEIMKLTLNSAGDRNALTVKMLTELLNGIDRAEAASRVILIDSLGEMFCSGASLPEVARKGMQAIASLLVDVQRRLSASPLPVVSVVRARVQAGGFGLLGASDIVLSRDDVLFQFTEVRNAVAPAVISLNTLHRMPSRRAAELMLTGREFNAAEAVAAGIVTRTAVGNEIDVAVEDLLQELLSGSPQGLAETKQILNRRILEDHDELGQQMASTGARLFNSDEAQRLLLA
jgi:enoyl-CoA hydratase